MKNLFICLLTLLTFSVQAQNFEGTIRWSVKSDITDPATKQKMEHAQSQMNDPNNAAKMKELEEKMKDPQFQKMMEQNPQLKAQMEQVIAMQKNGGGMESMMPKSFTMKAKNGNTLTKIEGGMMESEILYLKDKDQRYSIYRSTKKYSPLPKGQKNEGEKPQVKVTKTNETAKILNYNCTKYIVESTDSRNMKHTQYIWTTTEIKDIDPKAFSKSSVGGNHNITYEGIEGVPMRISISSKEMNMTMEVVEIKKETLNNSDFMIPADFVETKTPGLH